MIGLASAAVPALGLALVRFTPLRSRAAPVLVVFALLGALVASWTAITAHAVAPFAAGFFVVDATVRLFLLLINLVFLGIATYVWSRVLAEPSLADGLDRYVVFAFAFMAACNLAVLSNHMVAMWGFLELTTLAAIPLIQHGGEARALRASWKYFLYSSVGLSLAFLGFLLIARGAALPENNFPFFLDHAADGRLVSTVWGRIGLVLLLVGLGTKLGLVPMYSWLPDTYEAAPPATTALLAAVQFNVALVCLLRVLQVLRPIDPHFLGTALRGIGLATMAVSSLNVIATRSYKKLIAYASINHGGVIAIGLGLGADAAYGVVLYVVSNALIKAILFLTAGKIRSYYRTDDIREVSGLIKDLPYSGVFFMVGTFALLGLPPFGSFLGELMIMSGLMGGDHAVVFGAFCFFLTVTFVATGRTIFPMIWGESKKKVDWGSQPITSVLPKLVFFSGLVAMGLYLPPSLNDLFREVARTLGTPTP